jgi:predicted alpha/beta-hydrolase family hydrolase
MKRRTQAKRSNERAADVSSKAIRIAADARKSVTKNSGNIVSKEMSTRYASIMSYYYNAETAEIDGIVNALKAGKDNHRK